MLDRHTNDVSLVPADAVSVQATAVIVDGSTESVDKDRDTKRKAVIRSTWKVIESSEGSAVMSRFYDRLLSQNPDLRSMFTGGLDIQTEKLYMTFQVAIRFLDDATTLVPLLEDVGVRHAQFGVVPAQYKAMVGVFLQTMQEFFRSQGQPNASLWNNEAAEAWTWVLNTLSSIMINAAAEDTMA